jgi:Ser/Thr protein kinase RdoA (MazF antagonist)
MLDFLYDPFREIETYRSILPEVPGPPAFFGAVADARSSRWWLFLERVHGVPLTEVGDGASWREAARWLARMHRRFEGLGDRLMLAAPLIWHDAAYYRRWLERSSAVLDRVRPDLSARARARFDRLAAGYEGLIDRLTDLPMTFLHGEFFPANVLIEGAGPAPRIRPIDWEMAAVGPGAIDLAALVGGEWSEDERASMTAAYREELEGMGSAPNEETSVETLDLCRLHLAVQRLGWSPDWSPPPEHAHDWLGEALDLVERLGL